MKKSSHEEETFDDANDTTDDDTFVDFSVVFLHEILKRIVCLRLRLRLRLGLTGKKLIDRADISLV